MTSPLGDDELGDARDDATSSSWRRPRSTVELLDLGSAVLVVLAGVLLLSWLWTTVRNQQQMGGLEFSVGGDSGLESHTRLLDRLDPLIGGLYQLGEAGLVLGAGLLLRAMGDLVLSREAH
jgi:hypothetical protein